MKTVCRFFVVADCTRIPDAVAVTFNAAVHHFDFLTAYPVPADYDIAGKMTYGDYSIGDMHTFSLDIVNHLIDMLAAAVEFR